MQFTERINLQKAEYLNQMDIETFSTFISQDMKKSDVAKSFKILKTVCKQQIRAKGAIDRLFAHTMRTPLECGGRIFCGNSIQGMTKVFRGFLCEGVNTDVDMANAHPVILAHICKENSIQCHQLNTYIQTRESILAEFPDRDSAKKTFLKALNDDKTNRVEKNPFFRAFDTEMKTIQKLVIALPQFKSIVEMPSTKLYNMTGTRLNRIMCFYEDKILRTAIEYIQNSCKKEVMTPMFDGFLLYGDHYQNTDLLHDVTECVNKAFPNLNMKWTYKPHESSIIMPSDFEPAHQKMAEMKTYEIVKKEFEESHIKIINRSVFLKRSNDGELNTFSADKLKTSYGHLKYETYDDETDKVEKCSFIVRWLQDEYMNLKENTGVYPNAALCPKNIYNLWIPFAMESVMEWQDKPDALALIRKHILILCGNDQSVADYFEMWLGQMIAHPETKSTFPVIISAEGSGKGTLLQLINKMLGKSKVLETTTPSRDVWGEFNSPMASCFFVCLNELSKKETTECDHRIKGLVTDTSLTINAKGTQQYAIDSYHRFIAFTNNNEGGINTVRGDRRKWIVRASDELRGDCKYFDKFYALLKDEHVIKTCYEYFKNLPDLDKFSHLPLPVTEHQLDLKEVNSSPIERWIVQYAESWDTNCSETLKIHANSAFDDYKSWMRINAPTYEISSTLFGTRLKQLNIDGISKGRSNRGNVYKFEVPLVKQWILNNVIHEAIDDSFNIDDSLGCVF